MMKIRIFVVVALSTLLFACEKDETVSPGGGGGGGVATPTAYRVNNISIVQYGENSLVTSVGWDADNILTLGTADIYVETDLGGNHVFTSEIEHNSNHDQTYDMSDAAYGGLPLISNYDDHCTVTLYDDDGIWGQDWMGERQFIGSHLYQNDEATTFSVVLSGNNNLKVLLTGTFSYQ